MKIDHKPLVFSLLLGCPFTGALAYASPDRGPYALSADDPIAWLGASNSSVYGMVYEGQFANLLTPRDAAALVLDYGSQQFRLGLTWARVIDPKQRFKISLEHFAQNSDYDFAAGTDSGFIGQNQIGAEYEYALLKHWVKSFVFHGYYVMANNGDFQNATIDTATQTFTNIRGLTGGSGGGVGMGPTWQPWSGARLAVLTSYDQIDYDTNYEPANNASGMGFTMDFTQQLHPQFALELSAARRSVYQQYAASLTWTAHHAANSQYGVSLQASYLNSDTLIAAHDTVIGLNFFYQWDAHKRTPLTPLCFAGDSACDSLGWSTRSAAYVPGVYVQMDQSVY